ncbi:hypothetical protein [Asticcacaulis taihuensis]|uniref:hypothetical protein n=1 Tax=Asticcacaulis taihuensis TaxID=260084 RepID=UPI0026F233C7|nr:hypothetical protein [Asticcacaulis taihuensis]
MAGKKIDRPGQELNLLEEDDEVHFQSVRDLSFWDPPMGVPRKYKSEAGEWVPIEPGEWRFADRKTGILIIKDADGKPLHYVPVVNPESGLPIDLPVQALGINKKTAYFMSSLGEVVDMAGNAGKGDYEMLFAGRNDYLPWCWPRRAKPKKDEERGPIVGWEADLCRQALIKWAGHLPTFRDVTDVRGRGMWLDDLGKPVYHAGNAIFMNGDWVKPGRYGNYIYPALPPIGRPKDHRGLKNTAGRAMLRSLETWNWQRKDLDPKLTLGWVMVGKMGAALHRRPTIWVTGGGGAGKSYLQKLLRSSMNSGLVHASNTTAAGIYQKLGQDCVPVLLDEMESKAEDNKIAGIIELFRVSYSGDELVRGDKGGSSKTYRLFSACMASSISKPAMESQDDSRMAILNLRPIEQEQDEAYTVEEAYKWGQVLTKRAIGWLPHWEKLIAVFERAMRAKPGHSARSLETFGPLAAGCHIALYDQMPTEAQLEEWAALLDPKHLVEIVNQIPTWEQCIRHMLAKIPDIWKNKTHKTLGKILREYMRTGSLLDVRERLSGTRVCVIVPKAWTGKDKAQFEARLFIPNTDPLLVDIFAGTAWKGTMGVAGPWNGVLRQAPQALWQSDTSTKGGLGTERGISFQIAELMADLGQDPFTIADDDADISPAGEDPAHDSPFD